MWWSSSCKSEPSNFDIQAIFPTELQLYMQVCAKWNHTSGRGCTCKDCWTMTFSSIIATAKMEEKTHNADSGGEAAQHPQRPVVAGVVNGVLLKKYPVTIDVYPEMIEMVMQMIRFLENTYEIGIRRGVEEQEGDRDKILSRSPEY